MTKRLSGAQFKTGKTAGLALPDHVAALLVDRIDAGEFPPGARLPTEQGLADLFGVSRNVVREAVARLRADGVVDARQGSGSFVLAPERRRAIRIETDALLGEGRMGQLFTLRGILETASARLAAVNRGPGHLDRLAAAQARMSGAERWGEGSVEADLAFHREVAAATGNPFVETFVGFICERIRLSIHYARATNSLRELVEVNLAEHERILAAIAAGDPAGAERAMRAHLTGAAARVGIRLGPNTAQE